MRWILSFLSDRTQAVQVGNRRSDERRLGQHSTPQGSVLGGLLHNLSKNDLPWTTTKNSKRTVYVDDATASTSSNKVDEMEELIQKEASDMSGWITDKRLSVAPSKSKFMMVGPDRTRKSGNWGQVKVEVENEHIKQTRSRIKRISRLTSIKNLKTLAEGLVLSKMRFGMALYATVFEHQVYKESSSRHRMFTRKDLLEMQRLMNSLARIVLRRGKRASTEWLMKDMGLLPFNQEVALQRMMFVLGVQCSGKPSGLYEIMKVPENSIATRFEKQMNVPRFPPITYQADLINNPDLTF